MARATALLWLLFQQRCSFFPTDAVQTWTTDQTSKLQVLIPQKLAKGKEGYDHRDALFGVPPYGSSIQQQVYYANSMLCNLEEINPNGGYPQRSDGGAWKTPYILMVDRGSCSFVQKVRNAQRVGASGVLIADNMCICDRPDCATAEGEACETQQPLMADDGSGSDISIPSFLVFKEDADEMKNVLKNNEHLRIQMSFGVPVDVRVEYELWTSPSDSLSRPIEESWGAAAMALAQHASFTPHLYIYDGVRAGCQEDACGTLCINSGLYCSTDPDDDMDSGASGADVVVEALRRLCIWNEYGKKDGTGKKWWDYVTAFTKDCDKLDPYEEDTLFNDDSCINKSMQSAGIYKGLIDNCMTENGALGENLQNTNSLLDEEINEQESNGVILIPSLVVNGAVIRGSLSFSTVLKAVCSGFAAGSQPKICHECANCPQEEDCVLNNGVCPGTGTDSPSALPSAAPSMAPSSAPSLLPSLHLETSSAGGRVPLRLFGGTLVALTVLFLSISAFRYQQRQRMMRDRGTAVEEAGKTSFGGTSTALEKDDDDGDDTRLRDCRERWHNDMIPNIQAKLRAAESDVPVDSKSAFGKQHSFFPSMSTKADILRFSEFQLLPFMQWR